MGCKILAPLWGPQEPAGDGNEWMLKPGREQSFPAKDHGISEGRTVTEGRLWLTEVGWGRRAGCLVGSEPISQGWVTKGRGGRRKGQAIWGGKEGASLEEDSLLPRPPLPHCSFWFNRKPLFLSAVFQLTGLPFLEMAADTGWHLLLPSCYCDPSYRSRCHAESQVNELRWQEIWIDFTQLAGLSGFWC